MILQDVQKELYQMPEDYFLARYKEASGSGDEEVRSELDDFYLSCLDTPEPDGKMMVGDCRLSGRVLTLATTTNSLKKINIKAFATSLHALKKVMLENDIKKVAMPRNGQTLNGLDVAKCRELITRTFGDTDIEILLCKGKEGEEKV